MALTEAQRVRMRRLQWACRRGLLELDLWLGSFVTARYLDLDAAQEADLLRLLDEPDPLLLAYLTRQAEPEDARLKRMVERIRAHRPAP